MGQDKKQIKDLDVVVKDTFGFISSLAEFVIWEDLNERDIGYLLLFKRKLNQLISKKQKDKK